MSTKADTAFSIAGGIIIDRGNLIVDVINSLFDAKYESKSTDYRI